MKVVRSELVNDARTAVNEEKKKEKLVWILYGRYKIRKNKKAPTSFIKFTRVFSPL